VGLESPGSIFGELLSHDVWTISCAGWFEEVFFLLLLLLFFFFVFFLFSFSLNWFLIVVFAVVFVVLISWLFDVIEYQNIGGKLWLFCL
jgi:hypothetical protein